ncbi:MAG: type I phosphomannose isomerase catalytic subunit, partial [Candidatus Limnocylindrales bacterium]
GQDRPLQVDQAMAALDGRPRGAGRVTPVVELKASVRRERLFDCEEFRVWRLRGGDGAFAVGAPGAPRVLVGIAGSGQLDYDGGSCVVRRGSVVLLPAALGTCAFLPRGKVTLLEIALPEAPEAGVAAQ